MSSPLFQATHIAKQYGRVSVLDGVSFDVNAGEIHALLGANGAGKSTLCKIISGLTPSSGGTMTLGSQEYFPRSKQDAEMQGVEMVQQELNLISTLSVAENLFLSRLPRRAGVLLSRKMHRKARQILDQHGLADIDSNNLVGSLGIGQQQMIEIASALGRKCRLLILDEPTAALSSRESQQLFDHLRTLRDQGVGILYISHRLDEIVELTNRVTILRDGRLIATHDTSDISTDEMVESMSGSDNRNVDQGAPHRSHIDDDVLLKVEDLSTDDVKNVSFRVRRGERFGISGLVGSGRTELLRAIFGGDRASSGNIALGESGRPVRFRHPSEATEAGIAMVTEDRKENGLLLSLSLATNTTLGSLRKRFSRFGCLKQTFERKISDQMITELDIKCESVDQVVGTLSGGNQQKIAIAKWLVRDADIFLFDEPTRGIDVASRRRIYRLLDSLAQQGKAIVIVSSDLDELMEICDSIAVMREGQLVQTFARNDWNREQLMQASFKGVAT